MASFLAAIWFRIGLFVLILLLVGIKLWMSRRKYFRERQERLETIAQQNSSAARSSFLLMEADLRDRESNRFPTGRNGRNYYLHVIENPPPPAFDDAIKCRKLDQSDEDLPPPSYSDYIKTVSTIMSSEKEGGNDKKFAAQTAVDVENYL